MLTTLYHRLAQWSRNNTAISRLRRMDDALLTDMGIARDCIAHAVRTGEK